MNKYKDTLDHILHAIFFSHHDISFLNIHIIFDLVFIDRLLYSNTVFHLNYLNTFLFNYFNLNELQSLKLFIFKYIYEFYFQLFHLFYINNLIVLGFLDSNVFNYLHLYRYYFNTFFF